MKVLRRPLRGIKRYPSKGRWYCYHRATGIRIRAELGTPEFDAEIAAAEKFVKPSPIKRPSLAIFNAREFKRLPPDAQARLRKLAQSIAAEAPNTDEGR
jgi:hypothetical protein